MTMTPEQIVDQIWQMDPYEVLYIALWDDVIMFCKFWPVWTVIILLVICYLIYYGILEKDGE
jgi:hypothetical protein